MNIETPTAPAIVGGPLTGPRSDIYCLSYRPDGQQLAAASTDGKIWIWDLTDATAAAVTEVHLWATDAAVVAAQICADQGHGITESEWRLYLPDQPYQPPCPAAAESAAPTS